MFYSRKLNQETNQVEIWECEWQEANDGYKKHYIRKVSTELDYEQPEPAEYCPTEAVCWSPGSTIGNIAVSSEEVFGFFSSQEGENAILPCHIIRCGKFRNGAPRWYCKTHQVHWGTVADRTAARITGDIHCSNHARPMSYTISPLQINFHEYEEIGVWCSLPAALSNKPISNRPPKIHVHKRHANDPQKTIDKDFNAVVCTYNQELGLFLNSEITKIQVTPPAAFEFVRGLEEDRDISCISCKKCGYPHLDLGSFAVTPHAKHFCGNCGNDSIWSKPPIVSNPLKPLHDQFNNSNNYITPNREINIDEYMSQGYEFDIWSSTPAIVWTANRPQEKGIHVHIYTPGRNNIIIDETFSTVIFNKKTLIREILWKTMINKTIY